jgi:circadian clock protein KaiC
VQDKISSGIYGLDNLIDGGLKKNSISVIIGTSGAGKTIFSLQFLLEGLFNGEQGVYITLDQSPIELIQCCKALGWAEIEKYLQERRLLIVELVGENFRKLLQGDVEVIDLVKEIRETIEGDIRIVLDPLTPLIWSVPDHSQQRELIRDIFQVLKKGGTTFVTIEHHASPSQIKFTKTITVPLFLADYAFYFQYFGYGEEYDRGVSVLKSRYSYHLHGVFPVVISRGFGAVVLSEARKPLEPEKNKELIAQVELAINNWEDPRKNRLINRLSTFSQDLHKFRAPQEIIERVMGYYNLI